MLLTSCTRKTVTFCQAGFAKEHVVHLTGHVEGCQQRTKSPEIKRYAGDAPGLCGMQDSVLAPEAGEKQRKSAQCQHTHSVGRKGNRHEFLQSAHATDVLLFVTA